VKWLQTNNRHELSQEHCLTSLAQFKMYEAGASAFWVDMEPEPDMPCTFASANDYANLWMNKTGGKHMCPVLIVAGVKSATEIKQKGWKCVAGYGASDHELIIQQQYLLPPLGCFDCLKFCLNSMFLLPARCFVRFLFGIGKGCLCR